MIMNQFSNINGSRHAKVYLFFMGSNRSLCGWGKTVSIFSCGVEFQGWAPGCKKQATKNLNFLQNVDNAHMVQLIIVRPAISRRRGPDTCPKRLPPAFRGRAPQRAISFRVTRFISRLPFRLFCS